MGTPRFRKSRTFSNSASDFALTVSPPPVVVKQQRVRVRLVRPAEALLDVGGTLSGKANSGLVIPDRWPQTAVLIQRFIDDIPGKDLAPVVSDDLGNVLLE